METNTITNKFIDEYGTLEYSGYTKEQYGMLLQAYGLGWLAALKDSELHNPDEHIAPTVFRTIIEIGTAPLDLAEIVYYEHKTVSCVNIMDLISGK